MLLGEFGQQHFQGAFHHARGIHVPAGAVHKLPEYHAYPLRGSPAVLRQRVSRAAFSFEERRFRREMRPQIGKLPLGRRSAEMLLPGLQKQPLAACHRAAGPAGGNIQPAGKHVNQNPAFHDAALMDKLPAADKVAGVEKMKPAEFPGTYHATTPGYIIAQIKNQFNRVVYINFVYPLIFL